MAIRVWRYNYGLGTIYAELDKSKTSIMDLSQKVFSVAEDFGYINRVEVTTESIGDDAFVETYNLQGVEPFEQPIEKLNITTKTPTKELIAFVEKNHDVSRLYFSLCTTGINEYGNTVLLGRAVQLGRVW
ncbi:hypothetical protein [Laceyella sacchari]|uniref:Uncharacterized protein n=1 Tax=Laceyella sacchari TaxID=37482 RepID=A0ABY5U0Z5_LACSH|nr:hypothetical protein [Laceyella sacchari]UWE03336.1 hypothetical protein NYR52_14665 [Laceyella sacchari]